MRYSFKLYVSGENVNSLRAIENLRLLCEDVFPEDHVMEVIDVLQCPERAERDRILATPTLIKVAPDPSRRFVGDLSARDQILAGLGVPLQVAPEETHVLPFPGQADRTGVATR